MERGVAMEKATIGDRDKRGRHRVQALILAMLRRCNPSFWKLSTM